MGDGGRWVEGVSGGMRARDAARRVLSRRLKAVARLLRRADDKADDPEYPHAIRVASRRADAAIEGFEPCLPAGRARKAQDRLRRIRRAAAAARDCDVHTLLLKEIEENAPLDFRHDLDLVRDAIARDRDAAADDIVDLAAQITKRKLRRRTRALLKRVSDPPPTGVVPELFPSAAEIGSQCLRRMADRLLEASHADLKRIENLHAFRIAGKHLRYAIEVFAGCVGPAVRERLYPRLSALQDPLGALWDVQQLIERLAGAGRAWAGSDAGADDPQEAPSPESLDWTIRHLSHLRESRHADALRMVRDFDPDGFAAELAAAVGSPAVPAPARAEPASPPASNGDLHVPRDLPAPQAWSRRLAAIDVGTNTIRLLVAEARPDGSYRAIDDEREAVRLGSGLAATGRLSRAAMERTAEAVARMKSIAVGYGVSDLRVIGTSAAREAANRDELASLIHARAGVELNIISADDEARLAFLSVAHAFDLRGFSSAVADIGGGSTEVVLAEGGVTEDVCSLPFGAVRLTEQFGGPEESTGRRFKEMRRHVRRVVKDRLRRGAARPQLLIGTGGTFTTLANMLIHAEAGPGDPALPWRGVPGYEAQRADVRHAVDRLRELPVGERASVPGLPADRADIIVAGLVILDAVMRRLRVNVVRVHDRGIRDGLIITMAGEAFPRAAGAATTPDPMKGVRRLAESCRYEQPHSEHVTRLALSIFDQLRAARPRLGGKGAEWRTASARRLLEAAGVLHDIGYLINYAGHHLHSFHLITHGDLPGFTRPEVEVIACTARYHRRSGPRKSDRTFARLSPRDRDLVRRLSGILRIADGLDRTHTQAVRSVRVDAEGGACRIVAEAAEEPTTDLWGAERKSDVFEKTFGLRARFSWRAPAATPEPAERRPEPAEA